MYKCCRWCKNFNDGNCEADIFETESNIENIIDDGIIHSILIEHLNLTDTDIEEISKLAKELKISKPKMTKMNNLIVHLLKYKEYELTDALELGISNHLDCEVIIKNEHDFICKEFR